MRHFLWMEKWQKEQVEMKLKLLVRKEEYFPMMEFMEEKKRVCLPRQTSQVRDGGDGDGKGDGEENLCPFRYFSKSDSVISLNLTRSWHSLEMYLLLSSSLDSWYLISFMYFRISRSMLETSTGNCGGGSLVIISK